MIDDRLAAAIDEGICAADQELVVEHADVVAWIASWDSPEEKPVPKCG